MARRTRPVRTLGAVVLGLGMAGLAGGAAVRVAGRRMRGRTDPALDTLLEVPEHVTHHHLRSNDGGTIHVVERGSGRPVLLLHGVALQWWVWSALIRLLEDRYRVLAWDMRGHGGSIVGHDGVTLEALRSKAARTGRMVVVAENHTVIGGLGEAVAGTLLRAGVAPVFRQIGLPDEFLKAGALPTLHDLYGISTDAMVASIKGWL